MSFMPLHTLCSRAAEIQVELDDSQLARMDAFAELIVETNKHFNLTRIVDPEDMVTSHFLDSLTCLVALPVRAGAKVVDVGSGPGFPGIPIKIARPDLDVSLMEATRKKADFIGEAIAKLGLESARPINMRAEEAGRDPRFREEFDIAYARALSEMKVLAELCLPLVRVSGRVVAQKSTDIDEELVAARPIIGQLGGQIEEIRQVTIPGTEITRQIVIIAKVRPTPIEYPRSYSRIKATAAKRV